MFFVPDVELGVQTTTDNKEVAEKADVLVLAIQPYQFADVIPEIAPVCKENALVISIAAGTPPADCPQKAIRLLLPTRYHISSLYS